jgi:hypothetical protein
MKAVFIFILLFQGIIPSIEKVSNPAKIDLICSIVPNKEYWAAEFALGIHMKMNPPGSAGEEGHEITHSYFFVVSDRDDYPEQTVFEIGEFYMPTITAVREYDELIEVDVEYFSDQKKVLKTIYVRHHKVAFVR